MAQKGYSKAEVLSDPLLAIRVVALKPLSNMAAWISPWQISDEPTFWQREQERHCSACPPPAS